MKKIKKIKIFYLENNKGKREILDFKDLNPFRKDLFREFMNIKKEIDPLIEPIEEDLIQSILIIGPTQNKGAHISERIYKEAQKEFEVRYISPLELGEENTYSGRKQLYPLSKVISKLKFHPDFIFIDECKYSWLNDCWAPVFYHQREFYRPPTVFYPDIAFFWNEAILNFFENTYASHWMNKVPKKEIFPVAIDPDIFSPKKKTISGIIGMGMREPTSFLLNHTDEITKIASKKIYAQEEQRFRDLGFKFFEAPITDDMFRDLLSRTEMVWIYIPLGQYTTRKMVEAMACRTVCVLKIENKKHEQILEKMGFYANEHYIKIIDILDLLRIEHDYYISKLNDIRDKAYEVVMERHLYKNRFEQIKRLYLNLIREKRRGVHDIG